jgi:hypothetical protein
MDVYGNIGVVRVGTEGWRGLGLDSIRKGKQGHVLKWTRIGWCGWFHAGPTGRRHFRRGWVPRVPSAAQTAPGAILIPSLREGLTSQPRI